MDRKISETDFKDSFFSEVAPVLEPQEKVAFKVTPGMVIGSLVGAKLADKKYDSVQDRERIRRTPAAVKTVEKKPTIKGNYYSQAENLAKNLRVVFTPVSAIYVVKNGVKDVAIETIDIEKMDNTMHTAWQNKDQEFFKRMLLNKMFMDINLAEKIFARNAIMNQNILSNNLAQRVGIEKKASFNTPDDFGGYIDGILQMRKYYERLPEAQKLASVLESMSKHKEVDIEVGLGTEPEKYASLGKVNDVFRIDSSTSSIRSLKKRLESPGYLKKNVQIGFLPDRVTFVVDNTLITSLPVFSMNQEGFKAFRVEDQKYFKRLFNKTIKINQNMQKKAAEEELPISLINIPKATVFRINEIHPIVYLKVLQKKYGKSWNGIDLPALIKRIELDFKLEGSGIPDIPLNKIMSIYTCLSEETANAFTSSLAFEKIVRSFNDLPIDFLNSESEGLGIAEITFGLEVYELIMADRGADAYELFSDEVIQYIADVMLDNDIVVIYPDKLQASDAYMKFYSEVNHQILEKLIAKNNLDKIENKNSDVVSAKQNEILQPLTIEVLEAIRSGQISEELTPEYVDELCEQNEFDVNKDALLRRQIQINLNTDAFLNSKRKSAVTQMELYKLV